jgi:hypothetical protein
VRPALTDTLGPTGPTQLHASGPECPYSLKHNLDECDSMKKRRVDRRVEARTTWIIGSTYLIAQPPQPSSRGNFRCLLTRSVHGTARGRASRTQHLVCQANLTQGADLQLPHEQ